MSSAAGTRRVSLLTFTTLYPNAAQPGLGLFVHRRLKRLIAAGGVTSVVVAPVPWFPLRHPRFGRFARYAAVPVREEFEGVTVHHPRFLTIPGLSRFLAPFTMLLGSYPLLRRLMRAHRVEVIDAHYFYPDAVAAAFAAHLLRRHLTITARGTDLNVLPDYRFCRWLILWAAQAADAVVTVSDALRVRLEELGARTAKAVTLRNGVDTREFAPTDRCMARSRLDLPESTVLLSVGNLVPAKGHQLVIDVLQLMPEAVLVIAGEGDHREALVARARSAGVTGRVRLTGALSPAQLIDYYSAADVLVLASQREGMPNVVLEALSCGLPVVTSNCGGVREVMNRPEYGRVVEERTAAAFAAAISAVLSQQPKRAAIREAAHALGWQDTIERQTCLYEEVVG